MFKLKNLYIAACLLGLTIYTAPALASICFAPSGGCVDALGSDVGDDRDSQGALNECIGFTLYAPEEGEGWSCSSCTQTTGTTLYKCRRSECGSEYNIKKDGEEPPKALPGWECEYCMRGYEKFWTCPKHYCAPKYGEKKHSASAAKFTCEDSNPDTCPHGDDILYNCECDADHVEREIDGVASCVRLCTEEHREYNPQTDKCECEQYYKELNGKCVHEEYSADCQAILNNFYAVNYSPLSSSECDSLKIRLGIKKCLGGSDYWAGAVKKCGGVDYMPTSEQLTKLAQCMYNSSSLATSIYGKRNDSYLEELGLSTDDHVFVWQDYQNKNNTKSMVRMFAKNESIPYWAERDGSKYYIGNGTDPTDWENTSILSQTLCRRDGETPEPVVSCDGCDYCIAGTCKDSGEKRIISDSSTYEKCADSCGGKYRCKTGYTAKYAGSNQYNCVRTSGCYYDTVAQCKTAGYTYTAEERWWMQDENMTHECEPCDCGGTEMNKCVPVECTPKTCPTNTISRSSWQYSIDHGITSYYCWEEQEVDDGCGGTIECFSDKCPTSTGTCYHSYSDMPVANQGAEGHLNLKHGYCALKNDGSVTIFYDETSPNCSYPFRFTNTSTGAITGVGSGTQTITAGTYSITPTGNIQSYTIRMGQGGTPSPTKTGTTNYTFSAGNDYWIVPNCGNGGSSGGGVASVTCTNYGNVGYTYTCTFNHPSSFDRIEVGNITHYQYTGSSLQLTNVVAPTSIQCRFYDSSGRLVCNTQMSGSGYYTCSCSY